MKQLRQLMLLLLLGTANASTKITITWQASQTPKVSYWVYMSKGCTGSYTRKTTTKTTSYSYNQANGTFCYYVASYLKTTSALSNIVQIKTP